MANTRGASWIKQIAQVGLSAKGFVYIILGALAFMAAFEIGGHSNKEATSTGALGFIKNAPGGVILLGLLAAGLLCYVLWRIIQAFRNKKDARIKTSKRLRYIFSALTYLALAATALKMLVTHSNGNNGNQNQQTTAEIMQQPLGQWAIGIGAIALAGIGIYQIFYGLSGKYKKHLQKLRLHSQAVASLARSGKIGYVARGVVWLIVAYLLLRAALHANAAEAGNTSKAFQFLENSPLGSYLLGALGLGLIAYGVFNFLRARYEQFD